MHGPVSQQFPQHASALQAAVSGAAAAGLNWAQIMQIVVEILISVFGNQPAPTPGPTPKMKP